LLGIKETFVEGVEEKKNTQEALNWLCLHIPEHRLPRHLDAASNTFSVMFYPEALKDDLKALGSMTTPKKKKSGYVAGKLASQGYPIHRCKSVADKVVEQQKKDTDMRTLVAQALSILMCEMRGREEKPSVEHSNSKLSDVAEDEKDGLVAILGDDFRIQKLQTNEGEIWKLKIRPDKALQKKYRKNHGIKDLWEYEGWWCLFLSGQTSYPEELPPMWFEHEGLAAQQRLCIIHGISQKWDNDCLASTPMVYEIVEYLKAELPTLLTTDPPKPKKWLQDTSLDIVKDPKLSRKAGNGDSRRDAKGSRSFTKRKKRSRTEDERLLENLKSRNESKEYQTMKKYRENLPAFKERERIINTLNKNRVLVISGETGCGKSTQIPQFLLDQMIESKNGSLANVICTQPRRISAVGLATRVAEERQEKPGNTVGYRIRLESKVSKSTRLTFMTNGILLRQLGGGSLLEDVSHVVVDEVHERSVDIDILLLVLKSLLTINKDLCVVLMSATVDAETFQAYFDECPALGIPGRTFPVQKYFLTSVLDFTGYIPPKHTRVRVKPEDAESRVEELRSSLPSDIDYDFDAVEAAAMMNEADGSHTVDLDLTESLIWTILEGKAPRPRGMDGSKGRGGILVFLPGSYEITALVRMLERSARSRPGFRACSPDEKATRDRDTTIIWPLALHSALPIAQQGYVFRKTPRNTVKVVFATNIAETSITVTDITYVIDTGKVKEMRYDAARKMSMLVETFTSKAGCTQRAGRAGRVSEGVCFRLFTRRKWEKQMLSHQEPEIRRTGLEYLILQLKLFPLPSTSASKAEKVLTAEEALFLAIQPPPVESIRTSVTFLRKVGALEHGKDEKLTPLGRHLAKLPIGNVQVGKMVLLSAIFGCVSPIATIAAMLGAKSPFVSPNDKREEANAKRDEFKTAKSDHLTFYNVFLAYEEAAKEGQGAAKRFCTRNFLSISTLRTIGPTVGQYLQALSESGFLPGVSASVLRSRGSDAVPKQFNRNANIERVVQAVIAAGLYPNILKLKAPKLMIKTAHGAIQAENTARELKFYTKDKGRVFLHPRSVNFSQGNYESSWLAYSQIVQTSKMYVHDSTQITPYSILLFGDPPEIEVQRQAITVDKWIRFSAPGRIAVLVRALREELGKLLATKLEHPRTDVAGSPVTQAILKLIISNGY